MEGQDIQKRLETLELFVVQLLFLDAKKNKVFGTTNENILKRVLFETGIKISEGDYNKIIDTL